MIEDRVMFMMMIVAGFITGMNVWVNNPNDIRPNLSDFYMALMMTSLMVLMMGLYQGSSRYIIIGIASTLVVFYLIRSQTMMTQQQYINSMIPHHSMAIMMSKKLLERGNLNPSIEALAKNIVDTQEKEIKLMEKV